MARIERGHRSRSRRKESRHGLPLPLYVYAALRESSFLFLSVFLCFLLFNSLLLGRTYQFGCGFAALRCIRFSTTVVIRITVWIDTGSSVVVVGRIAVIEFRLRL